MYKCLCEVKGYVVEECRLHGKKKACEVCGGADHEGQTCPVMVEQVARLREKLEDTCPSCATKDTRIKELEKAAKLSTPKEVEIYHKGQNANTASSVPLTRDFRKTVVERATKDPAFTDSLLDELQDRDTRLAALEKVLEAARRMPYAARTPLLNAAISAVGREECG